MALTISVVSSFTSSARTFARPALPRSRQLYRKILIYTRISKVSTKLFYHVTEYLDVKIIVYVNACRGREHEELADIEVDSLSALSISVKPGFRNFLYIIAYNIMTVLKYSEIPESDPLTAKIDG